VRIAIDIDSTLHHYWDQLEAVARRRYGIDLPYEDQVTWGITALGADELALCVQETHGEELVAAAEPYPGAVETIAGWHAAGHFVHITSHRSAEAREATAAWLQRVGLPHDDLHCSYDKIARCVELEIDLLVDDSPVNLTRAAEVGIAPATLLHPWNRELCASDHVISAEDWPTLARRLAPLLDGGASRRLRHNAKSGER
jgi:uncharacterized HAD superfamily protein